MESLWNETQAKNFAHNPLELRAYTSRLLGQNDDLVMHGGGNTSVKINQVDLFGQDQTLLYVKGSGHDLKTISASGFTPTSLDYLLNLAKLDRLSDSEMMEQLKLSQTKALAPTPSVEAILHALIPFRYVDHTHADAVVTITNSKDGVNILKQLCPQRVLILPYIMPGFILAKQVQKETASLNWKDYDAIILMHHGVFTFHDEAKVAYENMIAICNKACEYLKNKIPQEKINQAKGENLSALEMASIRHKVCSMAKRAMVARFKQDPLSVTASIALDKASRLGPLTPDHVIHTKAKPAMLREDALSDLDQFEKEYITYFENHAQGDLTMLDPAPRYALIKGKAIAAFGINPKRMGIVSDIADHTVKALQLYPHLGGEDLLPEKDLFDVEYWELEQAKLKVIKSGGTFEGQVAFVTGAASGIGKACALELLSQGAAVIGVDIDPQVGLVSTSSAYKGVICDITQSSSIEACLHQAISYFGGLDLLISNAGIFPQGQEIEKLDELEWQRCLDVNLTGHFKMMKASIPFLKLGYKPSIVVVGSKNVMAPGPSAASYSVSKAALTQLARVAALELGSFGIRVNVVHPNAVFDTAIWDGGVLEKRAASYNQSVEEYKKNNVLKTEISSQDVAKVIAHLAGPGMEKTTAAQIPVDGGNTRII